MNYTDFAINLHRIMYLRAVALVLGRRIFLSRAA